MKENPFRAPVHASQPPQHDAPDALTDARPEAQRKLIQRLSGHTFRFVFAFFCLAILPVFIVPHFMDMFEEFGIELPLVTQFVCRYSRMACTWASIFLPLSFSIFAAIEIALFVTPDSALKSVVGWTYWLVLILLFGIASLSIYLSIQAITSGLTVQ